MRRAHILVAEFVHVHRVSSVYSVIVEDAKWSPPHQQPLLPGAAVVVTSLMPGELSAAVDLRSTVAVVSVNMASLVGTNSLRIAATGPHLFHRNQFQQVREGTMHID